MTVGHDRGGSSRGIDGHASVRRLCSERFVGRERQLERVAVGLQSAVDGRPSALILSATAGMGLTRLLSETRRRIGSLGEPFAAVHGVATAATSGVPYASVGTALERLLDPLPDETLAFLVGPTGDAIARLVPNLHDRLDGLELLPQRTPVAAPEWREARMFEAVLGLLERLGQRQPVAFLIEDLHHADSATRGLVTFLARVTRGQRVMLLATYQPDRLLRTDPLRATLTALASSPSVTMSEVPPLERAELGQLIEAIEGGRPSSTTLLLVAERSRGNPLIAEELLAARRELLGVSLSGSLDRLVTARANLRSPECRRVLRLMSLAGTPIHLPTLLSMGEEFESRSPSRPPRSAAGARPGDTLEADLQIGLAEALEHGFLVESEGDPARLRELEEEREQEPGRKRPDDRRSDSDRRADADRRDADRRAEERRGEGDRRAARRLQGMAPPAASYVDAGKAIGFRHELVAEAIAADLLPATRRRYHSALAAAWDNEPRPRPAAALAHHLAAHELAEAENAALEAATEAEELDAGADAVAHYECALSLYEIAHQGEPATRLSDLYLRAGEAAFAPESPPARRLTRRRPRLCSTTLANGPTWAS